ncbi:DUF4381 domain-containing protein [Achromobacter arsenitoxydans]|uniref:Alpha-2 type XI collagen n=1 Tax=Achromobacter arsenitoxydans SY8 TaxID=477184 RepID=H0F8D8_9BURK|nr:DUF4381 domain-containing protein [Achromobacter arsenitoxydans]EHK65571.1 hypothetical protein KYC_15182 [Achromobacter arsenitoxydans SY8]
MSAALPGLDQLRELPLPAPVSYWPQTWGWAALALLLAAATGWMAARAWRRWHRNRYRREALSELRRIEADAAADPLAARGLPALLKRSALAALAPDRNAAPLAGEAWIAWLAHCGPPLPRDGAQLLATLAYAPDTAVRALDPADIRRLLAASRLWMERHHVEA